MSESNNQKYFTKLEVGTPYTLFQGRNMKNQTASILECNSNGDLFLNIYLDNITQEEIKILKTEIIETKLIQEGNYLLALIKYKHNKGITFEIEFDSTIYKDDRISKIKSNMLTIIGIESNTNIIQTLRWCNIPQKLHSTWLSNWSEVMKIYNYSKGYKKWIDDLHKRYSVLELWDWYGKYSGKIGE